MATRHNQIAEAIPMQESTQKMIEHHFDEEESLMVELRKTAEFFANYMNSRDMTNNIDEAVLNPIFGILYDRVDEDEEPLKTNTIPWEE